MTSSHRPSHPSVPDAATLLRFLEKHALPQGNFKENNFLLDELDLIIRRGTIVSTGHSTNSKAKQRTHSENETG